MSDILTALGAAGVSACIGWWILKSVRNAKETGVTQFPMQVWPQLSREGSPTRFAFSVRLSTVIGIGFVALAGAVVLAVGVAVVFG